MLRSIALLHVTLVLTACSHFTVERPYTEQRYEKTPTVRVVEGTTVVEVAGTPEEIGGQIGALFRDEIRELIDAMSSALDFGEKELARARELEPHIPEDYRRELRAMASASGVPYEDLLVANVVADTRCSLVSAQGKATGGRPLMVARNLDFHPARVLGGYTVVFVVRPDGKRPFVSVGWPGFNAVTSGFNDASVGTFVLLNYGAVGEHRAATPIVYRQRQVLEQAGSLEEGVALHTGTPVGSGHYSILCDPQAVRSVYQSPEGFKQSGAIDDILICSNGPPDPSTGIITDERACALDDLVSVHKGGIDESFLRDMTRVSYLSFINCQAMLLVPAERRLQLAVGTTFSPAATNPWVELDFARVLKGEDLRALSARELPEEEPQFAHYKDAPCLGERLKAALRLGRRPGIATTSARK